MFGFGGKKETVGLDIGASSVKAVQLRQSRGSYELVKLGIAPLPPETIVDGVIMDSGTVISAINSVFSENQIKAKDVVVAVSGHSVIVKKIKMQKMKPEELEDAITFEAEQYVPYAIEDVNLDFQILAPDAEGGDMDVLLVAVKKDVINDYLSIISTAGLRAVVVDVDGFALENCLELAHDPEPDQVVALVNLGAAVMNINILMGGMSEFTRDSPLGGNRYTESIQKMLGLTYEEAEKLKLGEEVGGKTFNDALPAVDMVHAELAGEIRRSFDFFRSSSHSDTIHKAILSGGCARLPGLVEYLTENLEVPFEVANPLRKIKADPKKFDPDYLELIAPQLAVSVGLALRQAGDKAK
jgi:type IV pilus assembly protein PilM